MRVLVAPDSFKGSLSSVEVARALAAGWSRARPDDEVALAPLADGGEGTLDAVAAAGGWVSLPAAARDPLMRPIDGRFLRRGTRAVVELATASGLSRVARDERDAAAATTLGTGQILAAAIGLGCTEVVLGLGGSATTDGGTGLLVALGARFLDDSGTELPPGGGALERLARVDLSGVPDILGEVRLTIASDVSNPLCGPLGAAATYGPQKGADPAMVARLDTNLAHLADLLQAASGRSFRDLPGAGAAGGTTAGLLTIADRFAAFEIRPGIELVMELTSFAERLAESDLVLTGEGRIDEQTAFGKTALGVARRAALAGVACVAFGGGVVPAGEAALRELGAVVLPVAERPLSVEEAMAAGAAPVERAAERAARLVSLGEVVDTASGPRLIRPTVAMQGSSPASDLMHTPGREMTLGSPCESGHAGPATRATTATEERITHATARSPRGDAMIGPMSDPETPAPASPAPRRVRTGVPAANDTTPRPATKPKKPATRKRRPPDPAKAWVRSLGRSRPGLVSFVMDGLAGAYGHQTWQRVHDPTSELVLTILSQNSADVNAEQAFEALRRAYPGRPSDPPASATPAKINRPGWGGIGLDDATAPDWDTIEQAPIAELTDVIRPGGLANLKAPRIQAALRTIRDQTGSNSLEFLGDMSALDARDWLTAIDGIGRKTASVVLLFSFGTPLMPVDRHVERVSHRIGLIPPKATADDAHELYLAMLEPDQMYEGHVNLIIHGRRTCHARTPACDACPVASRCRFIDRRAP